MIAEIVKNFEREPCLHHFVIKRSKFKHKTNMVLDASPHSFESFMALVLEDHRCQPPRSQGRSEGAVAPTKILYIYLEL